MVQGLNAILAIWDELNYNFFSNHGGGFRCNSSYLRPVKLQNFLQPWWKRNFSHLRRVNYKLFSNHGGELIAILAIFPLLMLYSCISDCYAENVGLDQEQDIYHEVVIKAQEQS